MGKFNIGDKVKLIANRLRSVNIVGDIGVVTEVSEDVDDSYCKLSCRVQVEGKAVAFNWSYESDLELVAPVTYEDHWRLNDGTEEIPEDADTLEKDGSVVAYRKVKEPDVSRRSKVFAVDELGYIWDSSPSPKPVGKLKITTTVTDGALTDVQTEILED